MTFLEAAIEVLRSSEEPLHYIEIARLAVERKLLSHVGRDPEAAMQSCLNSAVRSGAHEGLVMRSKPGHYLLREDADLPTLPPPPTEAEPLPDADDHEGEVERKRSPRGGQRSDNRDSGGRANSAENARKNRQKEPTSSKVSSAPPARPQPSRPERAPAPGRGSGSGRGQKPAPAPTVVVKRERNRPAAPLDASTDSPDTDDRDRDLDPELDRIDHEEEAEGVDGEPTSAVRTPPMPVLDPNKVRFRGPEGSGLEDETDVNLVIANAMSRLVVERPELREELEAMQKTQPAAPEVIEVGRHKKRLDEHRGSGPEREREREQRERERDDERGGRRRKRRRRRGRRVEWTDSAGGRQATRGVELLDGVANVLGEAGSRSLHVRQIAEQLATQNVLDAEISEIERAVTAAILIDVHRRGDSSRFAIRGDARYQLRGSRLPEKAAAAEHAARAALVTLENETEAQLLLWLQSLGARSLEALVRIWLDREDFALVGTLPPSRGLAKLIVEDPEADEEDGRTLVLIVPRKTSLEPKLWDGEAERNQCAATIVFTMSDLAPDATLGTDARVIFAKDFTRWLLRNGIGVRTFEVRVPVLDANLIESIAGLDT